MIVSRVEKHLLKHNNSFYSILSDYTHKSKNLYNHANYIIRKEFIENDKWVRYAELDKILKSDTEYDDYKQMPTAQSSQQVLRLIDKNWKSFFASIKDWSKHKDKYSGRPKLPKYKSKDGKYVLVLTNQEARLKDGIIKFPKTFKGFTIKPYFTSLPNFVSLQQVRFVPKFRCIEIELVYNIEVPDESFYDNGQYIGIDIGLDNLATIVNNVGVKPVIINGKGLKSINKSYNKNLALYKSIAKRMNGLNWTNRLEQITTKRNKRINDYMHKASKWIIGYALELGVNTIVVGNNKDWKRNSKMSKKTNQSFVGIPHHRLIEMIQYKAKDIGLNVILTEESYTSGTSFLDDELPVKKNYNKNRRVHRGLFVSNKGVTINADVNGAFQILRKVFPESFDLSKVNGILDVALHPIVVNAG